MFHAASAGLEERLASGRPIAAYNGFDPSGPWLHVGHLVPIFGLIALQRHGGRPVVVVGGGTGMIGDPAGRAAERALLDDDTISANVAELREQLGRFLDFEPGPTGALMVDNRDWLGKLTLIDFLRDVGKHFTIPYMLAKDSVQGRLERGLSYTEFSYMLLQAVDFAHLRRNLDVELQMGGADQWGNITAGLELIRRTTTFADGREPAFALAYPLLLTPSGTKFGKSESGDSIWLHAAGTSPYAFYQHWLNTDDRDVGLYLRWFTTLEHEEIEAAEAGHAGRPEMRSAQRLIARDLTARVHGEAAAAHAVAVSEAAFSRAPIVDPGVLATLHEAADGFWFEAADVAGGVVRLCVASGIFSSNGEARRAIGGGGLTINERRIASADAPLPDPIHGEWLVVRLGRRKVRVGRRRP